MLIPSAANRRAVAMSLAFMALVWAQPAQAQVKLQYKFTEGKYYKNKMTAKTHQNLTLMGMDLETKQNESIITSRTVGNRRGDSGVPVVEKVESLRSELSAPGGVTVTFDSSDPGAKIDERVEFLGEVFKLASQSSYTVVLDESNKLKAIEGAEKLREKAEKLSPPAQEILKSQFEADKLKRDFEQELRRLPDVLVRPGDTWDRTEILDIGSGQTLT